MVGPIDVKWKGGASVGYWVNYVTLTFDLIHDLTQGLISNIAVSQELLPDWCDTKRQQIS